MIKTVGFPISHKENEKRRAIVPKDIKKLLYPGNILIEFGFGDQIGIADAEYSKIGCKVCSRDEVLNADIICDPKIGDADYLDSLKQGQTIFGWIHATQNRNITDIILNNKLTAYAWEKMFDNGRHVFWFNNELAGEAAVIHAFECYGRLPYGLQVAVIGGGNTARGACKVLYMLGANVMQYNRNQETLLKSEIGNYDVIVNCVLWDVMRRDHIINKSDLKKMKKNSMIIDVSCDKNGAIETSVPTTIANPVYDVDGVLHYVVDHTPALFYKTFSYNNSRIIYKYIEELMLDKLSNTLQNSRIISNGEITDKEIIKFQCR